MKKFEEQLWLDKEKKIISCDETNKVLNENFLEIYNIIQSSFDDAVLMGCDENNVKEIIIKLVSELKFSIGKLKDYYHY